MCSSSSEMLPVLLVVCLFWRLLLCAELPGDHISLESSIRAGDYWVSKKGTFAIGLLQDFSPGDASQELMKLCIWYSSSLPNRTVVWTAASNGKVLNVRSNATFSVLLLGSKSIPGSTGSSESCEGCFARMQGDGNFVLLSAEGETAIWQSFDSPTDTFLPRESNLSGAGKVLLSSGKFELRLTSKSLKLTTPDFPPPGPDYVDYWSLHNPPNSSDNFKAEPTFSFRRDGVLTFTDGAGKSSNLTSNVDIGTIMYSSDYGSIVLRRLVLEPDGNLRIYSLRNTSWIIVWQAVLKECEIYATCGAFGVCSYRPTKTCSCPPGFHRDPSEGCVRSTALDCNSNKTKFVELARADYTYNDLQSPIPATTLNECKSKCLKKCSCLAVAYSLEGNGWCYIKGQKNRNASLGKLYNGVQSMDQNTVVFLKVSAASDPITSDSSYTTVEDASYMQPIVRNVTTRVPDFHERIHRLVVALSIGELVLFLVIASTLGLFWLRDHRRLMQRYKIDIEGAPAKFSFKELQAATNNFSEKLGSGAFGSVYKGVLPDNRIIAVKQLEVHVQAERQFKAEVSTIGSIHHINLVRLLGYCAEGNRRLLVLEYMPNGSLERLLFSSNEGNKEFCSWSTRYSIALGIARGITYLHEECHECILHCDIKPQNILLDENFQPKVSDFGLAKLMSSKDQPLDVTTIAGTRGYLAPEWVSNLQITSKVDVYSFGMVLLEILSGRDNFRATPSALDSNKWPFPPWAFRRYLESSLASIADPKLEMSEPEWEQFERMLKVAFWCIQLDANSRPGMNTVVQMLEKHLEVPQPPCPGSLEEP